MTRALPLLALLLSVAAHAAAVTGAERFFDQTLGDFSEELENAREQGKQGILIMFEMEECPFCHRMKTQVLNRPEVQDYFHRHFLIFPVDIEGDVDMIDFKGREVTQKAFAFRQYRVRATPVFAFFDLDGKLITRYTGATRDAEEFLLLGRYVVEGAHHKMPFSRYRRAHRARR